MSDEAAETAVDEPFLMSIVNVHALPDGGVALMGRVERGSLKEGDDVEIVGAGKSRVVKCAGIQDDRTARDDRPEKAVAVRLREVAAKDIEAGQVLAKPGSFTARTTFKASVYVLSADEGGRDISINESYRPKFVIREQIIDGSIKLPVGIESATPGESTDLTATLDREIVLVEGLGFAFLHGPGVVARGAVTEVVS
ncbi:EF-Tu/IF-2/RF-3 family GTPase [Kitasatospora viridis]|uniref:Elongation factor Tu n=1 Tax=Kitasatospora viridis TaxID=281105 RepID=A0A561TW86_9ACTN|nr:EF-Tu/IF-2/RF-3 family GTPase [Kitasatospora viridis]TWF91376.1 elongation factor Tu-like protein [Kitasatospora viridis]